MTRIFKSLKSFSANESGAAVVEYGIILGLIVVVGATALTGLGTNTRTAIEAACEAAGDADCQ